MPKKPSAFILDDDSDFNWSLKMILDRIGFEAHSFSGLIEFFQTLSKKQGPNVYFVDLNLRYINEGFSVLKFLRKKMKVKEPIFVVSSICSSDAFQAALEKGASDYLVKPVERQVLMNKLSQFINNDSLELNVASLLPISCIGDRGGLATELRVSSIHENGMVLVCGHLLGKGMTLTIEGQLLEEITGSPAPQKVTLETTELDSETGGYRYFAAFDPTDVQFLTAVRKWILENKLGNSL
jgi:DNA-binding response OmpR family regulator